MTTKIENLIEETQDLIEVETDPARRLILKAKLNALYGEQQQQAVAAEEAFQAWLKSDDIRARFGI